MDLQLMKLRKEAGYKNRDDFAKKLGVNRHTYRSWETGASMMSLEQAYNVTEALGCTLEELVGRELPEEWRSPDEKGLIDKYRLMDAPEREKLKGVADSFVIASEKDGPGDVGAHERAGRNLTEVGA